MLHAFALPTNGGSIRNLALSGQACLEKVFENGGWTDAGRCLYYKVTM